MKVYITSDIEGITGVTHWDETEKDKGDYSPFALQMTKEVAACCSGALKAGASEVYVKDSHGSGRNIIADMLPEEVMLIRGWERNPDMMIAGIDDTFDALMFVGYHSGCGLNGNPLSHTMNSLPYYVKINNRTIGEFEMHSIIASGYGVKPIFISSDKMQCDRAKDFVKNIYTTAVKIGKGQSTTSIHPKRSIELIEKTSCEAIKDFDNIVFETPDVYEAEIAFKNHHIAYRMSFYPGVTQINDTTIKYTTKSTKELAAFFMFAI